MSPSSNPPLALLGKLARIFQSSLNPRVVLKLVLSDALHLLRASGGSVALINPETQSLETEVSHGDSHPPHQQWRLGEGFVGWVALHGKSRRVPPSLGKPSALAVPLLSRRRTPHLATEADATVIGVLTVTAASPHVFSEADEQLLVTLSNQISSLIQNAWLYDHARRQTERLNVLLKSSRSLMVQEALPEALRQTTRQALRLANASHCAILLRTEDGLRLHWQASSDDRPPLPSHRWLPVDDSLLGVVIHRRKPIALRDFRSSDPMLARTFARHRRLTSLLAVPLSAAQQTFGALLLFASRHHRFSNEEVDAANTLANLTALTIQRCQALQKLVTAEEQIRRSERLSAIGLLAAEVAHEIRNPLTVMKMLVHRLTRETQAQSQLKDLVILSRKMDQMEHAVARILGLARDSDPVPSPLFLNDLVEDLLLLVRHKLREAQVRLRSVLAPHLPRIHADRAQIEQALLNLILNSVQAMKRGGHLRLRTGRNASLVWVEVQDSGHGIPAAQRNAALQPFFTLNPKGTGLGMAIVKKIVEAHRGQIEIHPRRPMGTTVRLLFPAASAAGK